MNNASRPPTAYIDRDEYGCFVVFPTSLVLDTTQGDTIRFRNLTTENAQIDLPTPLVAAPVCINLGGGAESTAKVAARVPKSFVYRVRVGGFEARGGSGPKVIVDP